MRGGSRLLARLGLGAAALVVGLTATALPASAVSVPTGRIDGLTVGPDGHLLVAFTAVGLPDGTTIDPASVKASLNDQSVPAVGKPVTAQTARTTILTIDVSGSMAKPIGTTTTTRIDAAKQAATAYVDQVPADVQVGVVVFADGASQWVAPTQDHKAVKAKIAELKATNGSTALGDGVILANKEAGQDGLRNQLILSDGARDRGATIDTAVASIKDSKIKVDAVSIAADAPGLAQLRQLTNAGKGQTVTAEDTATLISYFQNEAQAQANQLVVDITVPPNFAGQDVSVKIDATAGKVIVSDSAAIALPAAGSPPTAAASSGPIPVASPEPGLTSQPWFLPVAIGLVAVGLFGLLLVAFLASDRDTQSGRVRRRLSRYSLSAKEKAPPPPTSGALGQSQVARSAAEFAGRVVQTRDLDGGLALRLDAAGVPLRPGEWMLIHVGIAILGGLVFLLLSGFGLFATLLGLALGIIGPWLYLSYKEGKRKSRFNEQLPDTLQLLAGSLAAGYSLPQAVDTVVRESEGPMAVELNRALVEARLGVPIEDALETVAIRMDSMDFKWVVMALRIQREVGGNLAEVLTNVAATMRERERLRRQVDVLSAEGRLSAIILGALPLLFVGYLVLVRPEYIGLLVTTPLGILLIVVGVVLLIIGAFWLRKVVKVEV
ncbi:MAG: type II secretion system F family protein [Candidatus Nanopelagicales bacterium]